MIAISLALVLVPASVLVCWLLARDWLLEWGATDQEALTPMPGDEQVQEPGYQTTMAVTIAAEPADIWPWLMQMGYRRGGLYSYDWLDRLFGYLDAPSAERVLPEFQQLKAGDTIPWDTGRRFLSRGRTVPSTGDGGAADGFNGRGSSSCIDRAAGHEIDLAESCTAAENGGLDVHVGPRTAAFIMTRKMLLAPASRVAGQAEHARHSSSCLKRRKERTNPS
jgi:hypothetical protein